MGVWDGKVGVFTGSGGGIGRATALLFVERGGRAVIADVNSEGGEETVRMAGGAEKAVFVRADTTSEEQVQQLMETAVSTFGSLDFVHNNAAILLRNNSIEEIPVDEFRRVIDINLTGVFVVMRAAIPIMRRQRSGVIVNMSSIGALAIGGTRSLAYTASKAAVLAMTRATGNTVAEDGIRVNALMPGVVETPMTQGGPVLAAAREQGQPVFAAEDMARAALYCAETEDLNAAFIRYIPTPAGGELTRMKDYDWDVLSL